jgi:hypothetical protein
MVGSIGMIRVSRLDAWLNAAHVRTSSRVLAGAQALLLAFFIAGTHGWITGGVGPNTTDFASFYAAGALADAGTPELAYDQKAHLAAEERATEKGIGYEYFFYPPTFLLICAPLAKLPYLLSFVLFESATLALWLYLAGRIAGPGAMLPLLTCSSVWWTLGIGQNALLSAALMAAGTLLLTRRPGAAGAAFASLCYKPHLGLLVPVALLAGRQYRAFAAAAAVLGVWVGLSVLLFGVGTWQRFVQNELLAPATLYGGKVHLAAHIDMRGAAMLLGLPSGPAAYPQIGMTLLALAATVLIWRRGGTETRAASLACGSLAVIPFALFYDLTLATVAAAWLVRAGRRTGFLAGEKAVLGMVVLADLVAYPLSQVTHFPFGSLIAPSLLYLCYRRINRVEAHGTATTETGKIS